MSPERPPEAIAKTAALQAAEPRTMRLLAVLAAAVVIAVVVMFLLLVSGLRETSDLRSETGNLQSQLDALRVEQADAATKSQQLAEQVRSLGGTPVVAPAVPGATGATGATGPEGRGIRSTDVNPTGHLIITYTDGETRDVGQVVGRDGGEGPAGRGIADSDIVDGRLVLTYTDGERVDLGPVVGEDGGEGPAGRGIANVGQVDGRLVITYTDGATQDVGPLPVAERGPEGEPGRPPAGWTYTDVLGEHTCLPDTPPDPGTAPHYTCD